MSKKLGVTILAALLLVTVCGTALATTTYYVTGNNVRVRSGPGTDYEVLYHVSRGDKLYIEYTRNGWAMMHLAGRFNQDGYISTKFLSRSKPTSDRSSSSSSSSSSSGSAPAVSSGEYANFQSANYYVIVNPVNNYVNMRWEASKSSPVRKVYYYGTQLRVLAENAYWCQVMDETTNDVGFILKSLLLRTN